MIELDPEVEVVTEVGVPTGVELGVVVVEQAPVEVGVLVEVRLLPVEEGCACSVGRHVFLRHLPDIQPASCKRISVEHSSVSAITPAAHAARLQADLNMTHLVTLMTVGFLDVARSSSTILRFALALFAKSICIHIGSAKIASHTTARSLQSIALTDVSQERPFDSP